MSIFSKVAVPKVKRSTFNLSHENKFTGNFGHLMPLYWNYFEPGCTFKASSELMVRFAPLLAPIMHKVNIYTAWFKWPIRLGMEKEDFEAFMTGGENGTIDSSDLWPKFYTSGPLMDAQGFDSNPLASPLVDLMGVPNPDLGLTTEQYSYRKFDAMPFRCYQDIFNNYYRDQNIQPEVEIDKFTGEKEIESTDLDLLSIKSKCWEKDYFTSALPWAQRGVDVHLPIDTKIEIGYKRDDSIDDLVYPAHGNIGDEAYLKATTMVEDQVTKANLVMETTDGPYSAHIDNSKHLTAEANNTNTINDLRTALSLQRWFERNARVGARYIEQIFGHFGVKSDDARLQRPEYLGGSRVPLQVGEVLQTSESSEGSAQGTPSGRGVAYDSGRFIKTYTKEHCIIMALVYVVPKPGYFQGMPAKLDIRDRFDFPWPEFAHLGEQEIRTQELYYNVGVYDTGEPIPSALAKMDKTFGYQSRYAQFKFEPNYVHGAFRKSLDFWHLARKFQNIPTLSPEFLRVSASYNSLNRIFAVESDPESLYYGQDDHLWCQANVNIQVKRPLPYYSIPR